MSAEVALHWVSIAVGLLALMGVVFNAGRYGERLHRLDVHVHKISNEIIPRLVTKDMFDRELAHVKESLDGMRSDITSNNRLIMLMLGKLGGTHKDLENI